MAAFRLLGLAMLLAAAAAIAAPVDAIAARAAGAVLIAGGDSVKRCSPCLHPENTWFVGRNSGFTYTILAGAEIYRPADGVFVRGGDMGAKLAHPIATLLANHLVMLSGWSVREYAVTPRIARVLYDPAAGGFRSAGEPTAGCPDTAHEAMLWTLAGELELRVAADGKRELYQDGPVSGLPARCVARILDAVAGVDRAVTPAGEATLLPDGNVLVSHAPRERERSPTAAEIYDPTKGKFMAIGPMHAARTDYSVTQLKDGSFLIAGGRDCRGSFGCDPGTGTVLDSAEIYDPKIRHFTPTGKMAAARYHQTAIRLQDGRVLLAGGQGSAGESLSSAELYDASTGKFSRTGSMAVARQRAAAIVLP
jgi:galactose oxidase-like protein